MKHSRFRSGLLLAACGLCAWARGQDGIETFEGRVPDYFSASRPGSLSVSQRHSKHRLSSLRWDWRDGDVLLIRHGVGDIGRQGGYGGTYSKATFGVWLYCEQVLQGDAVFEFMVQGEVAGSFRFPLGFTGWRRAALRLGWKPQFEGKVLNETDTIRLRAPAGNEQGVLLMDLLVYNGLMDYRAQHVPTRAAYTPPVPDPGIFPLPRDVTPAEAEAIRLVGSRLDQEASGTFDVSADTISQLQKDVEYWRITRSDDQIRGRPLIKDSGFYTELGLEDVDDPRAASTLMKRLAQCRANTLNEAFGRRLESWYLDLSDHIADQGMVAGAGFPWGWYNGRDLATGTYLMRDLLRRQGRLARDAAYFDNNYGFGRVFAVEPVRPNMDYFHNNVRNMLRGCLMQASPTRQAQALRALSRRLSQDILAQDANGFKPDGSAFHHDMHYFAYANYSTNTLVALLHHLRGTPYQVSQDALERLRLVLMRMRFYCNRVSLPLALSGRHPHSGGVSAGKYLQMAETMRGADGELDQELVRAYLRLTPEATDEEQLRSAGLVAEQAPEGNLTMPWAGLMAHRRGEWLALVKGYSKYVKYGEIYAANNRYGRYLSHGYLDILGGGSPVTREDSGCVAAGWDWNRLDGTTVIHLPPEKLVAVSKGTEWMPSPETFVGGLSHAGRNGVFVVQIQGAERHDSSFRARKTYFLFDNRIVCLGSDIENDDDLHSTQTTLYQKHLSAPEIPTFVNGVRETGLGDERRLPALGGTATVLIDTQGTGYFVPGPQALHVLRSHQTNRDQHDGTDTEGDFASAWIDHGRAPNTGGYEYAVLVQTTPKDLVSFAAGGLQRATAPYVVLQRDRVAHAVFDRSTQSLGCVLFEAQALDFARELVSPSLGSGVTGVDAPCLLMLQAVGAGEVLLSVADPDLRLKDYISQAQTVRVSLGPSAKAIQLPPDVEVLTPDGGGSTRLAIPCREGRTYAIRLRIGDK